MREREPLGRRVVIKPTRKGKFQHGPTRNQQTGKCGYIEYQNDAGELVQEVFKGTSLKDLERKLRSTGRIPTYVTLSKTGETRF